MDTSQDDTQETPEVTSATTEADSSTANPPSMEVDVGKAMPSSRPSQMPVLQSEGTSKELSEGLESGQGRSMVAEGMHFVGNAQLRGPCSVAGEVDGNLTQAEGTLVAVVVTETGRVKGDITAQKISVMGHTDGVLDSGESMAPISTRRWSVQRRRKPGPDGFPCCGDVLSKHQPPP